MFSFRAVLLLSLFALIAIVGSTNGEPGCGSSSPSREEMYDEQTRQSMESADKFGRITLDCETYSGGGSGGNSRSATIIELSVGLFFLAWVAIGIWYAFVRRQKAMNAALVTPYPGEVGAKGMGMSCGTDEKTKTVAMSGTTGKLSEGHTNV